MCVYFSGLRGRHRHIYRCVLCVIYQQPEQNHRRINPHTHIPLKLIISTENCSASTLKVTTDWELKWQNLLSSFRCWDMSDFFFFFHTLKVNGHQCCLTQYSSNYLYVQQKKESHEASEWWQNNHFWLNCLFNFKKSERFWCTNRLLIILVNPIKTERHRWEKTNREADSWQTHRMK